MAKTSPTQRALKDLREQGYTVAIVEKYNSFTKQRSDLFGMFDLLAITDGVIAGVQVTSGDNHSKRVDKLKASPLLAKWQRAGGRSWVWSYAKRGPRGKRKTWVRREEEVRVGEEARAGQ